MSFDLKLLWTVVVSAFSGLAMILSIVAVRSRKEGRDDAVLGALDHRMKAVEDDLADLQVTVAGIPTRKELQALQSDITKVREEIGKQTGRLESISRALSLINQHLLSR